MRFFSAAITIDENNSTQQTIKSFFINPPFLPLQNKKGELETSSPP
jgi:hypothetical protein